MKIQLISLCFALALLPVSSLAADNGGFSDRNDKYPQSTVLPDNINNLQSQPAQQRQPVISRRQASNLASSRYEGRVLSIRLDNDNWRVRMDREGTVFNVFVNATSGDVSAPSD